MTTNNLSPAALIKSDFATVQEAYQDHMLLKNYSKATISTYLCNFRKYNEWCICEGIEAIYEQDMVRVYLLYRVKNGAK